MSIKTRLARLEQRLASDEPAETVITLRPVVVRNRQEVEALRAAGWTEDPPPRRTPRGPVRVVVGETAEVADLLAEFSKPEGHEGAD